MPLYSTTVSQSLRQTLRELFRGLLWAGVGSGLCQNNQFVPFVERDRPRFIRVEVHAVGGFRISRLGVQAVANGHLATAAGGLDDGVEVQWHAGFYVIGRRFQIKFRALGEIRSSNTVESSLFSETWHIIRLAR